jgi:hypothetical protein
MESNSEEMAAEDAKNQIVVEDAGIEYTEFEDLKSIEEGADLAEFVNNTIQRLTSPDWKENFYGFDDLRRFHKYGQFEKFLPKYAKLIIEGVENLRSSICRNSQMLVKEIYTESKDLHKVDESGEVTPYMTFTTDLIPIVALRLADDKVFLSSLAKQCFEQIAAQ